MRRSRPSGMERTTSEASLAACGRRAVRRGRPDSRLRRRRRRPPTSASKRPSPSLTWLASWSTRPSSCTQPGDAEAAYTTARNAYLDHFEYVEIPLRVRDEGLTLELEEDFAALRNPIEDGAPVSDSPRDGGRGPGRASTTSSARSRSQASRAPLHRGVLLVHHPLPRGRRGGPHRGRDPRRTSRRAGTVAIGPRAARRRRGARRHRRPPSSSSAPCLELAPVQRSSRGADRDARGRRPLLRLVLAALEPRPSALDGVRARPGVGRGRHRVDPRALRRRLHGGVPRGLRDGALLPGPVRLHARARGFGSHSAARSPPRRWRVVAWVDLPCRAGGMPGEALPRRSPWSWSSRCRWPSSATRCVRCQQAALLPVTFLEALPRLPIFLADLTGWHPTLQTILAQVVLAAVYRRSARSGSS